MTNAAPKAPMNHIQNLINDVLDINNELLYMDILTERQ
ncbi:hypothetical protein SAMN05216176_10435 [Nitratireductor indicus]|nr:hypothetical protein SAMN05216176_10435 [Nitratireductor indicus]